ncbi:MAG: hypothetical protein M3326_03735 [Actinomycetota bacterium]|nr:hypothetical protein [Actinomycetota bacterium]
MATGRQVDHLFWAVAEARRQRAEEEERRLEAGLLTRSPSGLEDGFVTEWQSADPVSLPV